MQAPFAHTRIRRRRENPGPCTVTSPGQDPGCLRFAVGLIVLFTFAGCRKTTSTKPVTITGRTMGTTYSVKIDRLPPSLSVADLKTEIDKRLETVNDQMSTYRKQSELSRFNRHTKADWFPVSSDTAIVVTEAKRIGEISDGAFDVTVGPLVNLWSFGPGQRPKNIPDDAEITGAMKRVGDERIDVRRRPPGLKKTQADVSVDLSAIAKGYGVDRVAGYLDELKIAGYMVEIGGEIRCKGTKSGGAPWKIGVQSPKSAGHAAARVVELRNAAMATSGDYRNYFEQDGKRFSHTIDPRTGRPVDHRLASVSVVAENCMTADALATAIMVLGPEAGYNFAEKHKIAALLLVADGDGFSERTSSEFRKRFAKSP